MTRHANLSTPASRSKLKVRAAPHYATPFGSGTSLGYRRMRGVGSWILRRYLGEEKYAAEAFALADDLGPADDVEVLTFHQAEAKARELAKGHAEREQIKAAGPPLTIARAIEEYADAREERWLPLAGSKHDARRRLARHVDEELSREPLALLTVDRLQIWRKSSGERVRHDFGAALNLAAKRYRDRLPPTLRDVIRDGLAGPGRAPKAAREIVALSDADVRRLVAAAQEIDAENDWNDTLARMTLTLASVGCRFSQLVRCVVSDVQVGQKRLMIPPSRKGNSSNKPARIAVPISDDVLDALKPAMAGRLGNELLFLRPSWTSIGIGKSARGDELRPWRAPGEFNRAWRLIAERAGLAVVPYDLRHAAIIRALSLGLPAQLVARLFDTSATMIQKNYSASIVDALSGLAERMAVSLAPATVASLSVVR